MKKTRLKDIKPGNMIVTYVSKKFETSHLITGWRMFKVGNNNVEHIHSGSPHDEAINLGVAISTELSSIIFVKDIGATTAEQQEFSWDEFLQTDEAKWMKRANKKGAK